MTNEEKISRLATEVMGWRKGGPDEDGFLFEDEDAWYESGEDEPVYSADGTDRRNGVRAWRPLTDWNHWRQVEEKVIANQNLMDAVFKEIWKHGEDPLYDFCYCRATLPTRVDALLAALDSVSHSK